MTVVLQIRDVPEDIRDMLARRAAELGLSLQEYLLDVVIREADQQRSGPHWLWKTTSDSNT